MDTQQVEILGRNRLIGELIAADLEVALPLRDRGIDLVAYADLGSQTAAFTACPIQMKAASARLSFGVQPKYRKFANIILAYVWWVGQPGHDAETYALNFTEALAIAETMGWVNKPSYVTQEGWSTSSPSKHLLTLLEPHLMSPEKWRKKILALQK